MCQVYTGTYVALLAPDKKERLHRLPPRKYYQYHVYITRGTYSYAYARHAQVNWKKKEQERPERKEKKGKRKERKKEEETERQEEPQRK